ncbi:MAG: hypothetical protein R2883_00175 [Caldisericia bacterium]
MRCSGWKSRTGSHNKIQFHLHRGLNYNHIFGEPVVGIVYFDPFWVDNKWERFDLDMYPTRQFSSILAPDTVSPDLDSGYDCYFRSKWNIEPEEIEIVKARDCISTLDQKVSKYSPHTYGCR